MTQEIRMSGPTLKVLRLMLERPSVPLSGASISKLTGYGSGTIYPLLQRLEGAQWITAKWENDDPSSLGRPRRRLYRLSKAGAAAAREALADFGIAFVGAHSWA